MHELSSYFAPLPMLWFHLMLLCRWDIVFGQSNDIVVEIANEYLDSANDFYSGRNNGDLFFKHLSDEFEWFVGSDSFSGKQTFIEANNTAFGAVDNVFGHHEVISYRNTDNDENSAFVLARLSTFNLCNKRNAVNGLKTWKCSFLMNRSKLNLHLLCLWIKQNIPRNVQAKVNHPECTMIMDATASDTDASIKIESNFKRFVKDIIKANDGTFEDVTDDCEFIGYPLSLRFDV
eukprot:265054_1